MPRETPAAVYEPRVLVAILPLLPVALLVLPIISMFWYIALFVTSGTAQIAALSVAIVISLLFLAAFYIPYRNVTTFEYRLFDDHIESYEGFLRIEHDSTRYDRVTDISFDRPWWQRPFGTGDIRLNTAGSHTREISLEYVTEPEAVYDEIRAIIWGGEQPRPSH